MAGAIRTVLIPVDFSINTEIAIEKALGFVAGGGVDVHLLHVVKVRRTAAGKFDKWAAEKQMEDWKAFFLEHSPSTIVKTYILEGRSVQNMILQCADMLNSDLIILGKHANRKWWACLRPIRPDALAQRSKCPVLTAKPGSIFAQTKLILIPIRKFFPQRKLDVGVLLAKMYKAKVHLLTIQEKGGPEDQERSQVFLRAYNYLKEKLQQPIEYSTIIQHNVARASIAYAERIMADMILVNPETESGIFSLSGNGHISDLLSRNSKIQILDIQPYKASIAIS